MSTTTEIKRPETTWMLPGMTIGDFRKDKDLVARARAMFQDPTFQLMMAILHASGPSDIQPMSLDADDKAGNNLLQRDLGWKSALKAWELLAEPLQDMKEPAVTFEDETELINPTDISP